MVFPIRARSSPTDASRRNGPSGRVHTSPTFPLASSASSRLPPPRSATIPRASGSPHRTPAAASCALGGAVELGDRPVEDLLNLLEEFVAVLRLAGGGGGQKRRVRDLHGPRDRRETGQVGQRLFDTARMKAARARQPPADPANHPLIEHRDRRTRPVPKHDQADRVRADIDHRRRADVVRRQARGHVSPAHAGICISRDAREAAARCRAFSARCPGPKGWDWS